MPKTNHSQEEHEKHAVEDIQVRIAEKVRENSQNLSRLTRVDSLSVLISDLTPDNVEVDLAKMAEDERYADIQFVAASTGTVYLYSATYITKNDANTLARTEEIRSRITAKIREDSQNLAKLTSIESLHTLIADLGMDEVEDSLTEEIVRNLAEMVEDERYTDIQSLTISTGAIYCYSETYITKNYAEILARAEANDPAATIAETVREESRIYPRPTSIELFKEPVFNIASDELETFIAQTLERQEFNDIKLIHASTGARYLYSNQYMSKDYAKSLIEWKEVGEEQNP